MDEKEIVQALLEASIVQMSMAGLGMQKIHILTVVDDTEIVYKYWSQSKQRWEYRISPAFYFRMFYEDDMLSIA